MAWARAQEPSERHPSADQLEALRRSLYSPRPDPSALAALQAGSVHPRPDEPLSPPPAPRHRRTARLRGGVTAILLIAVVGGATAVLRATAPPLPLPTVLAAPTPDGEVVASWSSVRSERAAPPDPAYQPSGYALVRPAGRSVRVVIRCAGAGTVTVHAGRRFVFRCTDRLTTTAEDAPGPLHDAFIVTARSTGDLVWAGTVALQPAA